MESERESNVLVNLKDAKQFCVSESFAFIYGLDCFVYGTLKAATSVDNIGISIWYRKLCNRQAKHFR